MPKWESAPVISGKWDAAPVVDVGADLASSDVPPEGAKPGSRAYADWALARVKAGKSIPKVTESVPTDPLNTPLERMASFTASAAEAVPIAGPKLRQGLEDMRARVQGMTPEQVKRETALAIEANPGEAMAGSITGTVAPFVLASTVPVVSTILGVDVAAPLAVNVVAGAGSQKLISHLDTQARGGDPNQPINIAGIEAKPEDIAAAAGAAGPVVGKVVGAGLNKLGETVVDPIVRTFKSLTGQADDVAEAALAKTIAADVNAGQVMSPADEAAAAAAGQPVINADRFGAATRGLARTAANADPNAREVLSEFVQDRFLTQNARAADWITRNTGAPTNIYAVQQGLTSAAKGANNPAYKAAYNAPAARAIWTPEIEQLMQSENFRKAAKAAIKSSNEEAALTGTKPIANPFVIDPKTGSYRLRLDAKGNPIQPSLEFWDHVQRQLRQRASNLARQGKNFDAGQVYRARQQLNEVLDTTVPEFAIARGGAARWFGAEDALEAGQKFVSTKLSDIAEATAEFNKFSPTEKKLFASGFASSLLDKIGSTPDSVNVINKIFANPQSKAQIELALGKRAAVELEPFLRVENAMQMTKQAIQGGSNTVQQLLALGVKTGGSSAGIGYGSGAAFGGLDPRNWGSKAWTAALLGAAGRAGMRALGKKVDQSVMHQIAKMLTSDDPKVIQQAINRAARNDRAADALRAIESGLALITRGAGMGAEAPPTEGTTE